MENHFNCIYCYTNKVNGKKYIGQAMDFNKRHNSHICASYNESNRAYNYYFHRAIRRHGIENFEIEILIENLPNQEELNYWECYYIVEFDTLAKNQKGYNLASGGYGNPLAGKTDEELAERSRKISEAHKGKNPHVGKTEEELAEIRKKRHEAMKNKSEEEMREISKKWHETWNNKSNEELAEFRKKQSEAHKGEKNPMYGRTGEKHPRATLVDRFDKQGNYIDTKYQFEYVQLGFINSCISSCCKGKRKTHKGFIFKYHEE